MKETLATYTMTEQPQLLELISQQRRFILLPLMDLKRTLSHVAAADAQSAGGMR